MASYNQDRFNYAKYDRAVEYYKSNEKGAAEEICASLVSDFECPRLVQIQAWQLRSLCTIDYWRAKSMLTHGNEVCDTLEADVIVEKYRERTNAMLDELEKIWKDRWAAEGCEPPEEQDFEDTYVGGDEDEEADPDADMLAKEYEQLSLTSKPISRGHSPEVEGVHGGTEKPWLKAVDGQMLSAATIITDAPLPPFPMSPATSVIHPDEHVDLPHLPSPPATSEIGESDLEPMNLDKAGEEDTEMGSDESL